MSVRTRRLGFRLERRVRVHLRLAWRDRRHRHELVACLDRHDGAERDPLQRAESEYPELEKLFRHGWARRPVFDRVPDGVRFAGAAT